MKTAGWKILSVAVLAGMLFSVPAWAEEANVLSKIYLPQCVSGTSQTLDDPLAEILSAQRGCCSWHGGVSGRCYQGRVVCNDGTLSPSCRCRASEMKLQVVS